MAKTLIIKNANFSVNKLDTVEFIDVPCTGITIDATKIINGLESVALVPTVTPADTTDSIFWTSSDQSIATVVGGMVTAHRYGEVTITATCGNYSASCAVSILVNLNYAKNAQLFPEVVSNVLIDGILGSVMDNNRYISIGAPVTGNEYPIACKYNTGDISALYPIPIPSGAKTVTINMINFACVFEWMSKFEKSTASFADRVRDSAKLIDGETPSSGTDWSIPSWTYNTRSVTIPQGVDSFAITLNTADLTAFSNFSISDISFIFGYE